MNFHSVLLAILYMLLCGYLYKDCLAIDNDVNDYDDYYDDYTDDASPDGGSNIGSSVDDKAKLPTSPYFVQPELQLYANEGENVIIDCDVQNINDNVVIMWYKNDMVIVSGEISVSHRVDRFKNNSIRIQDVQRKDGGSYYCEVLPERIRMHAQLKVATNLVIFCDEREVTNKSLVFQQGERHMCECKSFAKARNAIIKWFIEGEHAERVVTEVKDGKLYIDSADEKHGGIYQCLVDDGSETPPYGMILIDIFYAPKVSTHRHYVNAEPGGEAQLYCDNSANPGGIVRWLRKGKAISETHKFSIINVLHKNRNRTILNVMDVRTDDLGEYHCHAENSLGSSEIKVYIIYEPERPQLEDMQIEGKKVTLEWLVRSIQPLTEAVLDYKLIGGYTWSTQSVIQTRRKQKSDIWKIVHEMELTPGNWIVRLKTENSAGWSEFSDSHRFTLQDSDEVDESGRPAKIILAANIGGRGDSRNNGSYIKNNHFLSYFMLIFPFLLCCRMTKAIS